MEIYGNYQLLKRLATGGMAQIFLARPKGAEGFNELLVVKRILPHLAENDDFVRMFLDEARIAARLNHPNIVQIYDLGSQADSYFIAMEYIHGEDVRRVWKRADGQGKTFPIELVCWVVAEACSGLDHAHKKLDLHGKPLGIVHRDVSPQNILMTFDGRVKVVDFGIAKAADQATVTKSGVLKGKYSYMSPEQAAGRKLDARSDIFALGVVLYELLTGTRLFKRNNEIQTLNAVTACKVQPPSEVNSRLPRDLDALVLKALSKNPEERYQDAQAMHDALKAWLETRPRRASSAELAAFMREVYAERLAREAQEGRRFVGEIDVKEEAPPPLPAPRSGRVLGKRKWAGAPHARSGGADPQEKERTVPLPADGGAARALQGILSRVSDVQSQSQGAPTVVGDPSERFERPSGLHPEPENSWQTSPLAQSRVKQAPAWRMPMVTLVVLAMAAGVMWLYRHPEAWRPLTTRFQKKAEAVVTVQTDPAGATVVFAGKPVDGVTPVRLPSTPHGKYPLVLSRTGYLSKSLEVEIPEAGQVVLPPVTLAPEPSQPAVVTFTLRSEPTGAEVEVNGQVRGKTPLALEVPPRTNVKVRLSAPGFEDLERELQLTDEPFQGEVLTLDKREERPVVVTKTPEPVSEPKPPVGTVRFAVTPWAIVSCGRFNFGSTPFPDKQLPPGTYDCVFRNPEFGAKSERIEVRANETRKVTVRF